MQTTTFPAPRKDRQPRPPQPRSLNFIPLGPAGPHALVIRRGDTVTGYWLMEIRCDIGGRAFTVEKPRARGGETYTVLVTGHGVECDCPAGTYRGKCKHADAVVTLLGRGDLPPAPATALPAAA